MIMQNSRDTFESFSDGICIIWEMDEDGELKKEAARLRFQERTVGINRFYEAMTNKIKIDRLIRVQEQSWLTTGYIATIGDDRYEIKQVQKIRDTKPKSNDISLQMIRKRRNSSGKT